MNTREKGIGATQMNVKIEREILKKFENMIENQTAINSIDIVNFKQSMRNIASPVGVVTTRHGDVRHGLTATAICSVSMEPPSMLVCVNRSASAEKLIAESGAFAINMLSEDQHNVARLFSTPGLAPEGRYAEGDWHHLETGSPVLNGAAVSFDCLVEKCIEWGTHNLYIGRVVAAETFNHEILLYKDGAFRQVAKNR